MREEYRVFQIDKQDTVATALQDIPSGERVHIIGNCTEHSIVATTDIPVGHKMALKEIVSGEEILGGRTVRRGLQGRTGEDSNDPDWEK